MAILTASEAQRTPIKIITFIVVCLVLIWVLFLTIPSTIVVTAMTIVVTMLLLPCQICKILIVIVKVLWLNVLVTLSTFTPVPHIIIETWRGLNILIVILYIPWTLCPVVIVRALALIILLNLEI